MAKQRTRREQRDEAAAGFVELTVRDKATPAIMRATAALRAFGEAAVSVLARAGRVVAQVATWFSQMTDIVVSLAVTLYELGTRLQPVVDWLAEATVLLADFAPFAAAIGEIAAGFAALEVSAGTSITLILDGVRRLLEAFGPIGEVAGQAVAAIAEPVGSLGETIFAVIGTIGEIAVQIVAVITVVKELGPALLYVLDLLWTITKWTSTGGLVFQAIWATISAAIAVVTKSIGLAVDALQLLWSVVMAIPNAIGAVLSKFYELAAAVPGLMAAAAEATWEKFKDLGARIGNAIASGVKNGLASVGKFVGEALVSPGKKFVAPLVDAASSAAQAVSEKLSGISDSLHTTAAWIGKLGGSIAAIGAIAVVPLSAAANEFAKTGTEVQQLAEQSGLSAQAIGELGYAAKLAGSSASGLASAVERVAKLDLTDAKNVELLNSLNVELQTFTDAGAERRFLTLGTAIAGIADPLDRAAAAQKAFGGSGETLLKLFERGPAGLAAVRAEAQRLGLVMDGPAAGAAKAFTDAYQKLKDALNGVAIQAGSAVAPIITEMTERTIAFVKMVTKLVAENKAWIATTFKVASQIAAVGSALLTVAGIVSAAGTVIGGLATAASAAGAAIAAVGGFVVFILSPLALLTAGATALATTFGVIGPTVAGVTAAVAAGSSLWGRYGQQARNMTSEVMRVLKQMWEYTQRAMQGVENAIRGGDIRLAAEILWLTLQDIWARGLNALAARSGESLGGILDLLAVGDWRAAATAVWNALHVAFLQGMQQVDPIWVQFRASFDSTLTWLLSRWNTLFANMRATIYEWANTVNKSIIAPLAAAGVPGAEALQVALTKAQHALIDGPDIDVSAATAKLTAAKAALTKALASGNRETIKQATAEVVVAQTNVTTAEQSESPLRRRLRLDAERANAARASVDSQADADRNTALADRQASRQRTIDSLTPTKAIDSLLQQLTAAEQSLYETLGTNNAEAILAATNSLVDAQHTFAQELRNNGVADSTLTPLIAELHDASDRLRDAAASGSSYAVSQVVDAVFDGQKRLSQLATSKPQSAAERRIAALEKELNAAMQAAADARRKAEQPQGEQIDRRAQLKKAAEETQSRAARGEMTGSFSAASLALQFGSGSTATKDDKVAAAVERGTEKQLQKLDKQIQAAESAAKAIEQLAQGLQFA